LAGVLLTAFSGMFDALASSVARAWEVYGVRRIVVVYSERMSREWGAAAGRLRGLLGFLGRGLVVEDACVRHHGPLGGSGGSLCGSGGLAASQLRGLLRGLLGSRGEVVVLPTPGSRRLAMQLGMVAGGLAVSLPVGGVEEGPKPPGLAGGVLRLAYLDFCYGPWRGLFYPFVPRACTPLLEVDLGLNTSPPGVVAERLPRPRPGGCSLPGGSRGLPPLRCRVAWLAYMVNQLTDCSVAMLEGEEHEGPRWRLRVKLSRRSAVVKDVCSPGAWAGAARGFSELLRYAEEELLGSNGGDLAAFAGLEQPVTNEGGALSGSLIADTSLVYRGLHNLVHSGAARVLLPQCLVAEVTRAYAEAAKRRAEPARKLKSRLAYLALEEMLAAGAPVAPSPPGPCDTSIPEMPAHILSSARPATGDQGAYQYWTRHPATARLTEPILVHSRGADTKDPGAASYAVLQAIVVASTLADTLTDRHREGKQEDTQPLLEVVLEGEDGTRHRINTEALSPATGSNPSPA
jgi:hypothetical protein